MLLADALAQNGFSVERQQPVPIHFRGKCFDAGFPSGSCRGGYRACRAEICRISRLGSPKAVAHIPQTFGLKLGFLIDLSGELLKGNIERIVNGLDELGV